MYVVANIDLVTYLVCGEHRYREARLVIRPAGKVVEFLFYPEAEKTAEDWQLKPDERQEFADFLRVKNELTRYIEAILGDERFKQANVRPGQTFNVAPMTSYKLVP